jgi:Plavaka transposase
MPAIQIDILLKLWGATLAKYGDAAPFSNYRDLYTIMNSIPFGDTPWELFNVVYTGDKPNRDALSWMLANYDVWFRSPHTLLHNLISNPDFDKDSDYVPFHEYDQFGNHYF